MNTRQGIYEMHLVFHIVGVFEAILYPPVQWEKHDSLY